jgi:hypothetical protein
VENNQHIDQIIRGKFENFEPVPPDSVWENIRTKIGPAPPASVTGLILPILAGIAVIVSIVMVIVNLDFIYSPKAADLSSLFNEQAEKAFLTRLASYPAQTAESNENIKDNAEASVSTPKASNQPPSGSTSIPVRKPFSDNKISHSQENLNTLDNQPTETETGTQNRPQLSELRLSGRNTGELHSPFMSSSKFNTRNNRYPSGYDDYANANKSAWTIAAFFSPEFMHYPGDSNTSNLNYSFSLNPSLHFGNYFIQSGIGFRFAKDDGNYLIDYQKYLGSYQDVYNVTYDSTEQGIIPTYYTQTVEVFDSLDHYAINETKANYTYLEIPVLFGYQKDFKRFSLSLKGGPSMSLMIRKNVPDAIYPEDKIRIVNMDKTLPTRVNLNWQMMVSAGFGYNLSDKFSLNIEPTFRYFINPEYNNGTTTAHPYSFGIRAGIIYKLKD